MAPEFGIEPDDLIPLFETAQKAGSCAVHVGMGSSCFSPPWYFQHSSLSLESFQTVILSAGMLSSSKPNESIWKSVDHVEIIGDADHVEDIFTAIHAGYELVKKY